MRAPPVLPDRRARRRLSGILAALTLTLISAEAAPQASAVPQGPTQVGAVQQGPTQASAVPQGPARTGAVPAGPTLARIRATGVLVMGYRTASFPFSYLDAQLKPVGYTVELCERVIAALRERLALPDLEVRRVAVGSATRMPMVTNGTVDMECGITTNTAERARSQAFSVTIFVAETRLLTRNGERVQSLADLRGRAVVSTIGTTSIQHLARVNEREGLGIRIVGGLDDPDAFQLLRGGRADAFLMDDVMLRALLAQQGAKLSREDYVMSDRALTIEPYAIGLNRDDPAFKAMVDEVLVGLFRGGEIGPIYRRWFESPLPPSGLNLHLPMSPALRRALERPTDSPDPERYR